MPCGLKRSGDALFYQTPKGKLMQVKKLSPSSVSHLNMLKKKKLSFVGLK